MDSSSSSLHALVNSDFKWIFCGGKGGVGKTTSSCSLSTVLALSGKQVLLISTDPAHNLSDAFNQKFGQNPLPVKGFELLKPIEGLKTTGKPGMLYCMEIDPQSTMNDMIKDEGASMLNDLGMNIPGVDEAMAFAEIMKLVKGMSYDVVVFDTAPTGHTLRFLSFPTVMDKALNKIQELGGKFGAMMQQMSAMMGAENSQEQMFAKMAETQATIKQVNAEFTNPDKCTFVVVCIAEFLSLYESERMIQELMGFDIDVHNIIVNQLIFDSPDVQNVKLLKVRRKMQQKYLNQIHELYDDFNVVEMPLLTKEVRGTERIRLFGSWLFKGYKIEEDLDEDEDLE